MAEERVQRRLAAILVADVVGYSRLMGEDEAGTLVQLKTLRAELLEPKVAEFGGRIVKTTGDGTLIEFPSAVDAVQHAVDVQEAMRRRAADTAEDRRIVFRMGINVGDIIVEGDDLYGDGVNVAARLEGLAGPGEICVSGFVHAQVKHKLDLAFESMGEQSLKNIAEPVDVYQVVIKQADDASLDTKPTDAMFRRPAVAVLPFENMSNDAEQEYFADGLTEDIISALSHWRSFPVIARNSTFTFKGRATDIREVGEKLGARYIVEGSVRKAGGRIRVTAQLINSETGHHVWSEQYDRDLEDIFAVQDEITQQIAAIIDPAIERHERQSISAKPSSSLDAWEHTIRGNSLLYQMTDEANEKARESFQKAIELDPDYARAHSGLSWSYGDDLRFFGAPDRDAWLDHQLEAARRAVSLDETDAEARTGLSRAYFQSGQLDAALAESKMAVQFNPNSAWSNFSMGISLGMGLGRYDESLSWFEKTLRLNPADPRLLYMIHGRFALSYLGAEHYELAAQQARSALDLNPTWIEACIILASSLGHLGQAEAAQDIMKDIDPSPISYVEERMLFSFHNLNLRDRVIAGLRKAGLPE